MDVRITKADINPIVTIGNHAGLSTGKGYASEDIQDYDTLKRRVENCYKRGHMSVFEAAHLGFYISGISRACSHQLVRHRLMSPCQQSQRYTKIDVSGDDWYVTPHGFEYDEPYKRVMRECAVSYLRYLDLGVKPEDARYVLPEATKTNISIFTNLREFFAFLYLRQNKNAQWEIREMANLMEEKVRAASDSWNWIMDLRNGD